MRLAQRCMDGFNRWFASRAGVWQTFGLSVIATSVEFAFPHLDPNGFKWLYLCTVWSFFTQNALAYSSQSDSENVIKYLKAILEADDRIESDVETMKGKHHARQAKGSRIQGSGAADGGGGDRG